MWRLPPGRRPARAAGVRAGGFPTEHRGAAEVPGEYKIRPYRALPVNGFVVAPQGMAHLSAAFERNDAQIDGRTQDVMGVEPLDLKFQAFGFNVIKADGHDFTSLFAALNAAGAHKGAPTCILAKTIMGKGVSYMEAEGHKWHGQAPGPELTAKALEELGA